VTLKDRAGPLWADHRTRVAAALTAVALGLAACAGWEQPGSALAPLMGAGSPIGTPPTPASKPAPPAATGPGAAAIAAVPPQDLEIQPKRNPDSLIGLDEAGMRARFGEPVLIEEQPPGVRWKYDSPGCAIDVLFFMEVESEQLRVLSYEITEKADAPQSEQQCLADHSRQSGASERS